MQMLGIVVTYAIVMLQFEMDEDKGNASESVNKLNSVQFPPIKPLHSFPADFLNTTTEDTLLAASI